MREFQQTMNQFFQERKLHRKWLAVVLALSLVSSMAVSLGLVRQADSMTKLTTSTTTSTPLMNVDSDGAATAISNGTAIDLSSYLTSFTLTVTSANDTTANVVASLSFSGLATMNDQTASEKVSSENPYLYIEITDDISVTDLTQSGTLSSSEDDWALYCKDNTLTNTSTGDYYFVTIDGKTYLVIELNDNYLEYLRQYSKSNCKGSTSFNAEVDREETEDGDKTVSLGGIDQTIEFPDIISSVAKSGSITESDGTVLIMWTVTIDRGEYTTLSGGTVSDSMMGDIYGDTIYSSDGAVTYDSGSSTITFTDTADTLDTITFYYYTEATADSNGNVSGTNEVIVTPEVGTPVSSSCTVTGNVTSAGKSGSASYDAVDDTYITWTISLLDMVNGLSGATVSDSQLANANNISVTDSSGNSYKYTVNDDGSITLQDGISVLSLTVTYQTAFDVTTLSANGTNVANTVTYTPRGKDTPYTDTTSVYIYNPYTVDKSGVYDYDSGVITWTVEVYSTQGADSLNNFSITESNVCTVDSVKANSSGGGEFSYDISYDSEGKPTVTITSSQSNSYTITYSQTITAEELEALLEEQDSDSHADVSNTVTTNVNKSTDGIVGIDVRSILGKSFVDTYKSVNDYTILETEVASITTTEGNVNTKSDTVMYLITITEDGGFANYSVTDTITLTVTGTDSSQTVYASYDGVIVAASTTENGEYVELKENVDYTVSYSDDGLTMTITFKDTVDEAAYKYVKIFYTVDYDYDNVQDSTTYIYNVNGVAWKDEDDDKTFVYIVIPIEPIEIEVNKEWEDDSYAQEVTFTLQYSTDGGLTWSDYLIKDLTTYYYKDVEDDHLYCSYADGDTEKVKRPKYFYFYDASGTAYTITLNEDGKWSDTFEYLPSCTIDGKTITYRVVENIDTDKGWTVTINQGGTSISGTTSAGITSSTSLTYTNEYDIPFRKYAVDTSGNKITSLSLDTLQTTTIDGEECYYINYVIEVDANNEVTDYFPEGWTMWMTLASQSDASYDNGSYESVSTYPSTLKAAIKAVGDYTNQPLYIMYESFYYMIRHYNYIWYSQSSLTYNAEDGCVTFPSQANDQAIMYTIYIPVDKLEQLVETASENGETYTVVNTVICGEEEVDTEIPITEGGTGTDDGEQSIVSKTSALYGTTLFYEVEVNPDGVLLNGSIALTLIDSLCFDASTEDGKAVLQSITVKNALTGEELDDTEWSYSQTNDTSKMEGEEETEPSATFDDLYGETLTELVIDVSSVDLEEFLVDQWSVVTIGTITCGNAYYAEWWYDVGYVKIATITYDPAKGDITVTEDPTWGTIGLYTVEYDETTQTLTIITDEDCYFEYTSFEGELFEAEGVTFTASTDDGESISGSTSATTTTYSQITFILPDGIPLIIEYSYKVYGVTENGDSFTTSNTISTSTDMEISSSSSDGGQEYTNNSDGTIEAMSELTIVKTNIADSSRRLVADFYVMKYADLDEDGNYEWYYATEFTLTENEEEENALNISIPGDSEMDGYWSTDINQAATFSTSDTYTIYFLSFETNMLYCIQEVVNPEGYEEINVESGYVTYLTYCSDKTNSELVLDPSIDEDSIMWYNNTNKTQVAITNNQVLSVSATKTWASLPSEDWSVELTLYSSYKKSSSLPNDIQEVEDSTQSITSENPSATVTWTDILNGDGTDVIYYYVVETAYTIDGTTYTLNMEDGKYYADDGTEGIYLPTYSGQGVSLDEGTVTVTNNAGLTVIKLWYDATGNQITDTSEYPDIKYVIYGVKDGSTQEVTSGTLTASDGYTANIDTSITSGYTNFTIKETYANDTVYEGTYYDYSADYYVSYSVKLTTDKSGGTLTIYNKEKKSDYKITLTKEWVDNSESHNAYSIDVTLYYSTDSTAVGKTDDMYVYDTYTLTEVNKFTKSVNVPLVDESGNPYYYWAVETTSLGGYKASYTYSGFGANDDSICTADYNSTTSGNSQITVTNTSVYESVSITLPLTGGSGVKTYYIIGASLLGLAVIFWRRRQKQCA